MNVWREDGYDVGTTLRISAALSTGGAPVDASAVVLKIKRPDDTVTTLSGGSIIHDGVGGYHADYSVPLSGTYAFRFESTTPTSAEEGRFYVRESEVI